MVQSYCIKTCGRPVEAVEMTEPTLLIGVLVYLINLPYPPIDAIKRPAVSDVINQQDAL